MTTALMSAQQWAKHEFSETQLGDRRRSDRAVKLARALVENEGGPLTMALGDWGQLKGGYRLLSHPEVSYEKLIAPHLETTRQECADPGVYLVMEDTTDLDFTGRQVGEQMGWTGDGGGRGMYLHSSLAVRVRGWHSRGRPRAEVAGLLAQKWWTRRHPPRNGRESRGTRLKRARESGRWTARFKEVTPPPGTQWIYVADRESDIYEALLSCRAAGVDFVVRANQNRALEGQEGHLFQAAAGGKVLGQWTKRLRARRAVPARRVTLQIRVSTVTLRPPYRPGQKLEPLTVNVVDVRQIGGRVAGQPLHWVLLTDLPSGSLRAGRRIVWCYEQRWLVEEYHKALKTGTRMEQSQLRTPERIRALLGINAVLAVRLLQMKLLARTRPDEPIPDGAMGPEALLIFKATYGEPPQGWTNRKLLVAIARLGGFLARKGDGLPGWLTIWRGWRRLTTMVQGFNLAAGET
jgi:hypothetical protein